VKVRVEKGNDSLRMYIIIPHVRDHFII